MIRILVIHGPNLQLLGTRQPAVYGTTDLAGINRELKQLAIKRSAMLTIIQSNHEGQLVEQIGAARGRFEGLLINAAAYTHTSVAIRDAVEACGVPAVEVHLSNIYAREPFRHTSLIAPVCRGQISGFGPASYLLGLEALVLLAGGNAGDRPSGGNAHPAAAAPKPRPAARRKLSRGKRSR